ncbi:MAG: DUF4919 domain-containing protein [Prevotellaceae bacterium]|jgi:hypothetical protein|nr:DUF4919 domain-containing protein [Prevotellaceae bacterium]
MKQKIQKTVFIIATSLLFSLGSYAQNTTYSRFSVSFWQDGKLQHINAKNNSVTLQNKEFDILFGFIDRPISISVNASFNAATYNAAAKGVSLDKLTCFQPGNGMAEGLNNSDRSMTISDDAFNYWFYNDQEFHRFNAVKKEKNGGVAATRTISKLSDVATKDYLEWSAVKKPLYLVFASYITGDDFNQTELHRDYIKINWIQATENKEDNKSQIIENEAEEISFGNINYEQIKKNIRNEQSNFHYVKLWNRFQQGDSTMTLEEKRHLYYGYVFHKNYSPFRSKYDDNKINAILNKEKPTVTEWKTLVSLSDNALRTEPFNCKAMYYQMMAYSALKQTADVKKNYAKINCILEALASSGNGSEKETAVHVIDLYSADDCLFFHKLSMSYMSLESGGYGVWYLNPNDYGFEKLWFDVNKPYRAGGEAYYKMFFEE